MVCNSIVEVRMVHSLVFIHQMQIKLKELATYSVLSNLLDCVQGVRLPGAVSEKRKKRLTLAQLV